MEGLTYNDIIEKLLPYKDHKIQITARSEWKVQENGLPDGKETHQEVRFFDKDGKFITGILERYDNDTFETIDVRIIGL